MPRTQGRYQQDLGFTDFNLVAAPLDIISFGTTTLTRNAIWDYSWNVGNSQTCRFIIPITSVIMQRLWQMDDSAMLENFGTGTPGQGNPGPTLTGSQTYSVSGQGTPWGVTGRPPYTGITQFTPVTGVAGRPKGFKLTDITLVYLVGGATLDALTIGVEKNVYANNTAIASTAILAVAANGLTATVQANPFVIQVPIAAGNQLYNMTDNSEIISEVTVTTGGSATFRLYRASIHGHFNWN